MPKTLYSQDFLNVIPQENFVQECQKSADILIKKIRNSEIAAIDVVNKNDDLILFQKIANQLKSYQKILVLGVGGSSLGGKTLSALKFQNKLEFLESIDPLTIKNCFDKIDLENTFFLVISKSGETIETICQTLILLDSMPKINSQQFLFVTESGNNSIAKIANKIGSKIVNHPTEIGGRFSCFCIVGMLPAIIAGVDAKMVREGAKNILEKFLNGENSIINSCAIQLDLYERGFCSNVIMPYVDNLKNFTDWYRQLWAESLGKSGFGSVPINSMGTIDQHSQLQLYLDGPKDKFFTFVTAKNHDADFFIKDLDTCKTLFGGKNLSEIVKVEQETTITVLQEKNLPIRIFEIEKLNEEVLGGLMMQMFLETMLVAEVKGINPFGQPAVELRKDLAKKILNQN